MGWRSGIIALVAAVVACGCSGTAAAPAAGKPLTVGCSTAVTTGSLVPGIHPVTAAVAGSPTAVVSTASGRWVFASVTSGGTGAVGVFAASPGSLRLVRTVPLPGAAAWGMAMTHDGRYLLVADYRATVVLRAGVLEQGHGDPVAGVLADAGTGQFEVAVSADDRYAFVSDETSGALSVFDLARALRDGFTAPRVAIGTVPLAYGALGVAVSPDGSRLYVTTFGGYGPHGLLWVIDAPRAEDGAGDQAVLGKAYAGCQPVRVAVSPDGATAWVTTEQSNALLAFATADLARDPGRALRAVVPVGSEPAGLVLADGGRIALVANSNRGLVPGTGGPASQTVSVISTAAALAGRPAAIGAIPAGRFARDLSVNPAVNEAYLGNFNSGTIEEFPVPTKSTRGGITPVPDGQGPAEPARLDRRRSALSGQPVLPGCGQAGSTYRSVNPREAAASADGRPAHS
jgi:DNA-binding beta-propeller fold protein YncE